MLKAYREGVARWHAGEDSLENAAFIAGKVMGALRVGKVYVPQGEDFLLEDLDFMRAVFGDEASKARKAFYAGMMTELIHVFDAWEA